MPHPPSEMWREKARLCWTCWICRKTRFQIWKAEANVSDGGSSESRCVSCLNRFTWVRTAGHSWRWTTVIALPVNPHSSQRPHSRARNMLGYHQYLLRTLPTLFPPKSFYFWRDFLCEEAWEIGWAFDTIVALGALHRATLLLLKESGNDRDRGLDTIGIPMRILCKDRRNVRPV
jgi:hypothetical protein